MLYSKLVKLLTVLSGLTAKKDAMNPRNIVDIPHKWDFIQRLYKPDGHKLFMDLNTGLYAIAGLQEEYPEDEGHGILWLVPDQGLEVDLARPHAVWVDVYWDAIDRNSKFLTNLDGALCLSEKLGWPLVLISPEGRRIKVNSTQILT